MGGKFAAQLKKAQEEKDVNLEKELMDKLSAKMIKPQKKGR